MADHLLDLMRGWRTTATFWITVGIADNDCRMDLAWSRYAWSGQGANCSEKAVMSRQRKEREVGGEKGGGWGGVAREEGGCGGGGNGAGWVGRREGIEQVGRWGRPSRKK